MGDEYPVQVPIDSEIVDRTLELRATSHDDIEALFNDITTIVLHLESTGSIEHFDLSDLDLSTEPVGDYRWEDTNLLDDLATLGFLKKNRGGYTLRD